MSRVLTMSGAAGLILAGVLESSSQSMSSALFAAGFLVVGVWVTLEVLNRKDD